MIEFIFHPHNDIFSSALILMLFISLLEGLMSIFGAGVSTMLEKVMPSFDIDGDIGGDSSPNIALSKFFNWIRVKKVPVLMLIVIFLTAFGIVGLSIQSFVFNTFGSFWNQWIVAIPTLFIALYMLNILGGWISKILPKDETSSISSDDLIGHIATITLGKASQGSPAEAKTQDQHGQTHYFMVEPNQEEVTFSQGQEVLILAKNGIHYLATDKIPDKLRTN